MDRQIKKNYFYNLISQLLTIIVPVITTPYISRVLGVQAIGDFSYTSGIVSYFCMIAMLGTANYAQREIAKKHDAKKEVSFLFKEILLIRFIMVFLVLLSYLIFINISTMKKYYLLFIIQTISFFGWGLDITWLFQGLEAFKIIATRNIFIKLFSTILILTFVKNQNDLLLYTFIYCCSELLGNVCMWFDIKKHIIPVKIKIKSCYRHFRGIIELFLPNIAIQLYTVFDKTMLGSLVNTMEVGYYSQAEKIIRIIITAINSLFIVLLPRLSYLSEVNKEKEANEFFITSIKYTYFFSIPIIIGCILVTDYFVPVFFGAGYEMVSPLMKVLSMLFIFVTLEKLLGTIMIAYNKQKVYTFSLICAALVNIVLNYFFISVMHTNAIGVAISSVISEFIAFIIQLMYLPKGFERIKIITLLPKYLLIGLVMGLAIICLNSICMSNLAHLILDVLVGSIIYIMIIFFSKKVTSL